MDKLKTLKDFEKEWKPYETKKWETTDEEEMPKLIFEELRQEAIKHIKELDKELFCECGKHLVWRKDEGGLVCSKCDIVQGIPPEYDQIEWIKQFFNISEKDLK